MGRVQASRAEVDVGSTPITGDHLHLGPSSVIGWPQRSKGAHLVKVRDIIKLIEADGWALARQRGSHRQYKHPTKPGLVTIAGHPADDVKPGTLASILKQAGLKGSAEER